MAIGVQDLYPPTRIELLRWQASHHLAYTTVRVGHCLLQTGKLHGGALQYLSGAITETLLVDRHDGVIHRA
jgi:hypothetical protein